MVGAKWLFSPLILPGLILYKLSFPTTDAKVAVEDDGGSPGAEKTLPTGGKRRQSAIDRNERRLEALRVEQVLLVRCHLRIQNVLDDGIVLCRNV